MGVPGDSFWVIGGEEIGFLDSGGEIYVADEDFMKPGGAGAAGAYADEVGEDEFPLLFEDCFIRKFRRAYARDPSLRSG